LFANPGLEGLDLRTSLGLGAEPRRHPDYGRAEALNRRRELARWLRMAAAAAASSPSAIASEMERCSCTTWSKWSRA